MILSHKNHPSNHQILQVALQAAERQLLIYFIDLHTFMNRKLWSVGLISIEITITAGSRLAK